MRKKLMMVARISSGTCWERSFIMLGQKMPTANSKPQKAASWILPAVVMPDHNRPSQTVCSTCSTVQQGTSILESGRCWQQAGESSLAASCSKCKAGCPVSFVHVSHARGTPDVATVPTSCTFCLWKSTGMNSMAALPANTACMYFSIWYLQPPAPPQRTHDYIQKVNVMPGRQQFCL